MANYLTPEGLDKFKKELDYLENTKRKEISERIRYTAAFGDLKENAAYHEAKDAQGFLEARIRELKGIVANARALQTGSSQNVQIGSRVSLLSAGEKTEYQIVCPEEADISSGKLSCKSPLGEALMGKGKRSKVKIETPGGQTEYKILEIK